MKKIGLLLGALMLLSGTAMAKDLNGKFGLGYNQYLGGAQGLAVKYWIGDIGINAAIGLDFVKPDSGDSSMGFDFALGGVYNFARSDQANLGVGLIVDLGFKNKQAMGGGDSSFQFNFEIPLAFEYFFSDHFAVNLATGLVIAYIPKNGSTLSAKNATGVGAGAPKDLGIHFGAGSLFGTAGFTFYF